MLRNPADRNRAIPLTYEQVAVPAAGAPLFQGAVANFNSGWREVADTAPAFVRRFVG